MAFNSISFIIENSEIEFSHLVNSDDISIYVKSQDSQVSESCDLEPHEIDELIWYLQKVKSNIIKYAKA
jgi:hypothetical protein